MVLIAWSFKSWRDNLWNKMKNFPIPEYHLALLVLGFVPNFWSKTTLSFTTGYGSTIAGFLCVFLAVTISVWSTASFGGDATEQPRALRVDGPYRFSRNPMYVGWTLLIIGFGLLMGSWWLLGAAISAAVVTHYRVVPGEEKFLLTRFGQEYEAYRRAVPRWLGPMR